MKLVTTALSEGIASIRLDRPEALNALNPELGTAFLQAARWASASDARVILISGSGRAFCVGGDLAYLKDGGESSDAHLEALIDPMHAAVLTLAQASQPVIVSLHGGVAGAGMSLALAADLAIAADNAAFTLAYVKVGVTPDCGGSWFLPRLVGMRRAMEIALLGDRMDAHQAQHLGLVNWVVPADSLDAEANRLAHRVAEAAPLALAGSKGLIKAALDRDLPEHLEAEKRSFLTAARTRDFQEALGAFFEKRSPRFEGR